MTELVKVCTQCLQRKPLSDFPSYFDKVRQKRKVRAACKTCMNQLSAIWRALNPGYHSRKNAEYKAKREAAKSIPPSHLPPT